MSTPPDPADPLDAPLGPVLPRDVLALAGRTAIELRGMPASSKTVLPIYRCPLYIRYSIEAVAEETTGGAMEPAAVAALEVGIAMIRRWPGVRAIGRARRKLLPLGDPETLMWLSSLPIVTTDAADTDDSGALRLHIPRSLARKVAKLARTLGLTSSTLAAFAVMAGLLHAPRCTPARYRCAMVATLTKLKGVLHQRGEDATGRAEHAAPRDAADDHRWTAADLLDAGDDDADRDADGDDEDAEDE
jgi:hypothetical protein